MSIQNPHDRFFRDSFSRPEIARSYLEEYLPAELSSLLDLTHLVLQDSSFLDETMEEHQTDLLYEVQMTNGEMAYVYFLFEHKSYPDLLVILQLLRYMIRFWERQVKEKRPLSPIVPLVIYHGEQVWSVPVDFFSLLNAPEALRPYQPDFRYHLTDLSHLSDETIRGDIWLRVAASVLRATYSPHLREELDDLVSLIFQLLHQRTGLEYIRTVLYYLTKATGKVTRDDLERALLRQGKEGERAMNTIAQEYIQEGIAQGLEQGRIQQMQDNILDLLHIRFDYVAVPTAKQVTAVTDTAILRQLLHTAATAAAMDTFVDTLTALTNDGQEPNLSSDN
jgi:predicted transposase/invertase (TIGR01784 family)